MEADESGENDFLMRVQAVDGTDGSQPQDASSPTQKAAGKDGAKGKGGEKGSPKKAAGPQQLKRAATRGEGVIGSRPERTPGPKTNKKENLPDADAKEMKRIIDDAIAQTPAGYSREVRTKVTIKGGVKLTHITITDTDPKGKVTMKTQKLGTKAGMKGEHHGKLGSA